MKLILLLIFLSTVLFGKICYSTKNSHVCFKRYYDVKNLKNPVKFKEHYISQNGYIYTFSDKLKLNLKYSGAILYILDNYELEFIDAINQHKHILKVVNKNELFSIISILNKLDSVNSAKPVLNRVYKKGYKKPKTNKAKERKETKRSQKSNSGTTIMQGFN
ncbi:MAG: hypothetical protein U9R39_03560 [Campylobacterota bacterium]|nr:hypothetical protein [Campylobacterota bacterium]